MELVRHTGVKLRDFIRELIALRAEYPVLCRKNFLTGKPLGQGLPKDVLWWNAEGREMTQADWDCGFIAVSACTLLAAC